MLDKKVHFKLVDFRAATNNNEVEARVKVKIGSKTFTEISDGCGQVDCLDKALRKALERIFPFLKEVKLTDYHVSKKKGKNGASSPVIVTIIFSDKQGSWEQESCSPDIIKASLFAIVEGFNCAISRELTRKA